MKHPGKLTIEDHNSVSDSNDRFVPGWPGITCALDLQREIRCGAALNQHSRAWYTLSHGILNEVYFFPASTKPATRNMGLIITDGHSYFSEEQRPLQVCEHGRRKWYSCL